MAIDESPATPAGGGRGLFPAALARSSVSQFSAAVPHFAGNINAEFSTFANNVPTKFEWSPWDTEFGNFVTTQMAKAAAGKESWTRRSPPPSRSSFPTPSRPAIQSAAKRRS